MYSNSFKEQFLVGRACFLWKNNSHETRDFSSNFTFLVFQKHTIEVWKNIRYEIKIVNRDTY